jgi:hypothetical protein
MVCEVSRWRRGRMVALLQFVVTGILIYILFVIYASIHLIRTAAWTGVHQNNVRHFFRAIDLMNLHEE